MGVGYVVKIGGVTSDATLGGCKPGCNAFVGRAQEGVVLPVASVIQRTLRSADSIQTQLLPVRAVEGRGTITWQLHT